MGGGNKFINLKMEQKLCRLSEARFNAPSFLCAMMEIKSAHTKRERLEPDMLIQLCGNDLMA